MAFTIRQLSPQANKMLNAYMETYDITSKTKAIDKMLADHKEFNNLKMKNNLIQEEELRYKYRYKNLVKSLDVVKAHLISK